jgi:hypothetical protein
LLIKAKQQHGKNQNKNTGFFINCMDFVVVALAKAKAQIKTRENKIIKFSSISYVFVLAALFINLKMLYE